MIKQAPINAMVKEAPEDKKRKKKNLMESIIKKFKIPISKKFTNG